MPPDTVSDPNNPVLSRELYDLIIRGATLPVLLLLIGLSWLIISRLMNSEWRRERRNREIRRAVEARQARQARSDETRQERADETPFDGAGKPTA